MMRFMMTSEDKTLRISRCKSLSGYVEVKSFVYWKLRIMGRVNRKIMS